MNTRLSKLTNLLLRSLLPQGCLVCSKRMYQGTICHTCLPEELKIDPSLRCPQCWRESFSPSPNQCCGTATPIDRHRYLWNYHGAVRDLIVAMKFSPSIKLARWGGNRLAQSLPLLFSDARRWDAIIPIPSSPRNYQSRLFSPSSVIASALSHKTGVKVEPDLLLHKYLKTTQAATKSTQRFRHARSAIYTRKRDLTGQQVLLVDDVVTTGATSAVSAQLLKQLGAAEVDLISLARAESWHPYVG